MMTDQVESRESITNRFARHVSSGKVAFYRQAGVDLILGQRSGVYVDDIDGESLIDCHCNGGVFNLGHRHPRILAALQQAMESLDIGNHHLVSPHRAQLGERLASLSPGGINRVVFGVSGGEAVDTAIKLARAHTGRPVIISAKGGYHGHTGFALAAGDDQYKAPFGPMPGGFKQVPFGDIAALEAAVSHDTAAILLETIPATLGIVIPPEEYFARVRSLCDLSGALMIMDEVQTGLGRTGAVWGIDTYQVAPDIIITGKGLSGGVYPITATLYHDGLDPFLREHPFIHVSTFGGSELGCAVALEVLSLLEEPGFLHHVQDMADHFSAGLETLRERHPDVLLETRQLGLMMGLKLIDRRCGPILARLGIENGLLVVYANNDPAVLQLLPPLIIQPAEVRKILAILNDALTGLEAILQGGQAFDARGAAAHDSP